MNKKDVTTAVGKLFMYSAMFHFVMLIIQAIGQQSLVPINYFNIIDLDYFFPGVEYGYVNHFLSAVFAGLLLYYLYTKEKQSS